MSGAVAAVSAVSLAEAASVATIAGAGIGAAGAIMNGQSQAASAKYNSEVAQNNATIATQNAQYAGAEGEAQAGAKEQQTRSQIGAITAAQGANGVDIGSGSNLDVKSSAEQLGQLDAINIRANAARQAYGYQTQATNEEAQSSLDKYEAEEAPVAGDISAGGSLLSGAGAAGLGYSRYLQAGGQGFSA